MEERSAGLIDAAHDCAHTVERGGNGLIVRDVEFPAGNTAADGLCYGVRLVDVTTCDDDRIVLSEIGGNSLANHTVTTCNENGLSLHCAPVPSV
jgi:hypothetical protein